MFQKYFLQRLSKVLWRRQISYGASELMFLAPPKIIVAQAWIAILRAPRQVYSLVRQCSVSRQLGGDWKAGKSIFDDPKALNLHTRILKCHNYTTVAIPILSKAESHSQPCPGTVVLACLPWHSAIKPCRHVWTMIVAMSETSSWLLRCFET